MIAEAEIWQVMCGREIYQADLDTLKQWVAEGLVLPADQVRKGNLRWLDAARVPALRPVFAGDERPAPPSDAARAAQAAAPPQHAAESPAAEFAQPVAAGVYQAAAQPSAFAGAAGRDAFDEATLVSLNAWQPGDDIFLPPGAQEGGPESAAGPFVPDQKEFAARAAAAPSPGALGAACYQHPQAAPKYVCRVCQTPMCEECPKYVGASRVALCPLCGDLCNVYEEVRRQAFRQVEKSSGFGFADFGRAAAYPFRNVVGLVGVSVVYSLLALGGVKGQILAYVIIFGCMSLVIKQMAWGRFDRGFLPDFSAMSLWDDVAVPCALGLGISLVTIGPAVVLFLALLLGFVGGGPSNAELQAASLRAREQQMARQIESMTDPNATGEEAQAALDAFNEQRAESLPGAKASDSEPSAVGVAAARVGGSVLLGLLLLASLLWAFFYYPMALLVAGFTEDFKAVINPLVGLDTIRRMGWNYVKAFLMYASVQAVGVVFSLVSMVALSAFDMPLVGNVPARFVEGGFHFYASLVIAATLGLALYKSSDELGIETD